MTSYRVFLSCFFLLLFCRIMVPEVAILALHEHEHTEDYSATSGDAVGKAHVHCDEDELYDSSFIHPTFSFELITVPQTGCYTLPHSSAWKFTFPNNSFLRGPPLA